MSSRCPEKIAKKILRASYLNKVSFSPWFMAMTGHPNLFISGPF